MCEHIVRILCDLLHKNCPHELASAMKTKSAWRSNTRALVWKPPFSPREPTHELHRAHPLGVAIQIQAGRSKKFVHKFAATCCAAKRSPDHGNITKHAPPPTLCRKCYGTSHSDRQPNTCRFTSAERAHMHTWNA